MDSEIYEMANYVFVSFCSLQRTKLSSIYIFMYFLDTEGKVSAPSQSEREGERTDLPLAGLEKEKGSLSFSLLSCLCLCLCLCLCFFFFFLCSWWWWWWWSLCLEDVDSLVNTERGAVATGCILISKDDGSLPSRLKTPKWIPVDNKESETKVRAVKERIPKSFVISMGIISNGRTT